MSICAWAVVGITCIVIWLLMSSQARDDARYWSERGICENCSEGDTHNGDALCEACKKIKRAQELKEKSDE